MSGKILLIVPPVRLSAPPTRFPLGLAYLAASLEQHGFNVSVLDLNILRAPHREEKRLVSEALKGVDVVGMGGMITMLNTIIRLTDYVKECRPDMPVMAGGPLTSHFRELILKQSRIDVLVAGEGEKTGPQVASALIQQDSLHGIPGLAFLENGSPVVTQKAGRIDNLDCLPMPAYHLFPFQDYLRNRGAVRSTDIIGSRGCPHKCTFCFRNFGRRVKFRSIESIMDEIRFLKYFYGINHICFEDELFVQRKDFIADFCSHIQKMGGTTWTAMARIDTLSPELLGEMKAAGCQKLMIGLESFSNDRLKDMKKGITAEQIDQVCTWINEIGIGILPGLIIGMPAETVESVQLTTDGCIRHRILIDEWSYAFATPYPGTELYEHAKKTDLITNEWEYILKLCAVGDTRSLSFNLTKFPDRELIQMRDRAIQEVTKHVGARPAKKKTPRQYLSEAKLRAASFLSRLRRQDKPVSSPFACVRAEHFVHGLMEEEARDLFKASVKMVEVEVFSFCNRRCWFCSNARVDRYSKNIMMDKDLYQRILRSLKEINYCGLVSYSRYNEPLADPVIFDSIGLAKEAVPGALLHLNTNGDYLNEETLQKLYCAGLRSLNIQIYLPEKKPYTDELAAKCMMRKLKEYGLPCKFQFSRPMDWLEYKLSFRDMQVRIYARNFSFNGVHRGGTIRELEKSSVRKSPCLIPFHDVYIDYNGKVVPCCNIRSDIPDHAALVLGDLNDKGTTLFSIFCSAGAASRRRSLIGFREKEFPCDGCSFHEIASSEENLKLAKKFGALSDE